MNATVNWLMPLLLLPGVGLLLVSTSSRYGQLHAEVHQLFEEQAMVSDEIVSHLLRRARLFRNALATLYASAALFAAGSVIGALLSMLGQSATDWFVIGFSSTGIISLIIATVLSVRESTLCH